MFAFLAALGGPIGIGAAIVGTAATAAYVYMKDDEKSESTKSKNHKGHQGRGSNTLHTPRDHRV